MTDDAIPDYIIRKRARNREYWAKNRERMIGVALRTSRLRRAADPGRFLAHTAMARAKKLGRLCNCCAIEQFIEIYRAAAKLKLEVDHIKAYCCGGWHCCSNLQALSRATHRSKTASDLHRARGNRVKKKQVVKADGPADAGYWSENEFDEEAASIIEEIYCKRLE